MEKIIKNLFIMPFDHRSSFKKALFEKRSGLSRREEEAVREYRKIIYEGFLAALKRRGDRGDMGILVDEEYGSAIIQKALKKKVVACLSVEKSGRLDFAFEYGRDFGRHILKFKPNYVKALVRYNPKEKEKNSKQLKNLKKFGSWCKDNSYKLMIELLIPPTRADLNRVQGNKERYDEKIRPQLAVRAVSEFHQAGIEPDVWKIEAFKDKLAWQGVINEIRRDNRENTGIIMLGRGESMAKVKGWIKICPKNQVNGFAIGRTIWWRAVMDLHKKKISRKQAINQIADNYLEFIKLWNDGISNKPKNYCG
ncbi:MAG: DUF2090 domain-containing protein [Candidatus Kuenenbacteria bacterium]